MDPRSRVRPDVEQILREIDGQLTVEAAGAQNAITPPHADALGPLGASAPLTAAAPPPQLAEPPPPAAPPPPRRLASDDPPRYVERPTLWLIQ